MRKTILTAISTALTLGALALAKDFWDKPYTDWKRNQVLEMLNDSPWAGQVVTASSLGGKDSGISGEKEIYISYTIRYFSALPIRQAYVRMMQIINKYDEMDSGQRLQFDQQFSRALNMDTSGQIIVAMEFASNLRELNMQVDRFLKTTRGEFLKQRVYLISDRLGRVPMQEYYPPSPDGTGAKFIFPRQVKGKPVVSAEDKEIKFEVTVPDLGDKILFRKKVEKMIYGGNLEI